MSLTFCTIGDGDTCANLPPPGPAVRGDPFAVNQQGQGSARINGPRPSPIPVRPIPQHPLPSTYTGPGTGSGMGMLRRPARVVVPHSFPPPHILLPVLSLLSLCFWTSRAKHQGSRGPAGMLAFIGRPKRDPLMPTRPQKVQFFLRADEEALLSCGFALATRGTWGSRKRVEHFYPLK